MLFSSELATEIIKEVTQILENKQSKEAQVNLIWSSIAYVKAIELAKKLQNTIGTAVYSGPFKGMKLTPAALTGPFAPKLLGVYEHELHPAIEQIIATPYQTILNIGCSFGYYTIGLALRMPKTQIYAFDISEKEQQRCREMVAFNNAQGRIQISGLFEGKDFANYAGQKTLVFMDIEAAEKELLDPTLYPALQKMDVVVELHDLIDATISKTILQRFASTHEITFILNRPQLFDSEPIIGPHYTDPFESLIMGWEVRNGPTPWAVMRVKSN